MSWSVTVPDGQKYLIDAEAIEVNAHGDLILLSHLERHQPHLSRAYAAGSWITVGEYNESDPR